MAQQKPVICQHCREKFVRVEGNFEKTSRGFYHIDCYKQIQKNKDDTEVLFDFLREIWGDDFINYPLIRKQIKDLTQRNNMTVQGITGTLVYLTNVKKMRLIPKMGIAIVPYHYVNARNYFEEKERLKSTIVPDVVSKTVEVEIKPQQTNKMKNLIDLESLLEE